MTGRLTELVNCIRAAATEGIVPSGHDGSAIAEEYAAACREANDRLARCKDYLSKSMRREALHLAESSPPLLDICASLDFPELDSWCRLCRRNSWKIPVPLDSTSVSMLNDAYAASGPAQDASKDYRSAVMERDTKRAIAALKRLATSEPSNQTWRDDISNFERRRLEEIHRDTKVFSKRGDIKALDALLSELNDSWSIPVDARIREELSSAIANIRRKNAAEKGRRIVDELTAAYSAMDFQGIERCLQAYELLLTSGHFQPDADLKAQYQDAQEWFKTEKERRRRDEDFNQVVADIRSELEKPLAGPQLEALWMSMGRFDKSLPDGLEQRVRVAIDGYRFRLRRRKMLFISSSVAALLTLVAAGAIVVYVHRLGEARASWARTLKSDFERKDLASFRSHLGALKNERSAIAESPEVETWVRRLPELEQYINAKAAEFAKAVDQLEKLAEAQFKDEQPAQTDRLMEMAKESALSVQDRSKLAQLMKTLHQYRASAQAAKDAPMQSLVQQISKSLSEDCSFDRNPIQSIETSLARIRGLVAEGAKIKDASPTLQQQFEAAESRLAAVAEGLEQRKSQFKAIDDARSADAYLKAMQIYADAFPTDIHTAAMKPVIERSDAYRAFGALRPIRSEGPFYPVDVGPLAVTVSTNNVFWYSTVRSYADFEKTRRDNWKTARENVISLRDDEMLIDIKEIRYTPTSNGIQDIKTGYLLGNLKDIDRRIDGFKPTHAMAMVYFPNQDDTAPAFSPMTMEKIYVQVSSQSMPHCAFIHGMAQGAMDVKEHEMDFFLAARLRHLVRSTNINPILRIRLVEFIANQMLAIGADTADGDIKRLHGSVALIGANTSWLCSQNEKTVAGNTRAREFFRSGELEKAVSQYLLEQMAKAATLVRTPVFLGHASFDVTPALIQTSGIKPIEIWAVRPDSTGSLDVYCVGHFAQQGPQLDMPLQPGEPLFTPAGVHDTAHFLQSMERASDSRKEALRRWPTSWPVNLR